MIKKEYIEQSSESYAFLEVPDARERYLLSKGFVAGAEWRIDKVWHDALEIPSYKSILVQSCYKCEVLIIKREDWLDYIDEYRVIRWAYIEDLIPINK